MTQEKRKSIEDVFYVCLLLVGTTTAIESLFTYGPNELHADHFNSSYVPMFMEAYDPILAKMDSGVRKRALRACEHSFQCIFDIAVTGREDIGEDTNDFQKWLLKMKRNLHDEGNWFEYCVITPKICKCAPASFIAFVGKTLTFTLMRP